MNVSIVIATHGAERWSDLAWARAYPSAAEQGAREVLIDHFPDAALSESRNALAARARSDWLVFLDADDELAPGYIEAMTQVRQGLWASVADPGRAQDGQHVLEHLRAYSMLALLVPAISYAAGGKRERPRFWKEVPLDRGNWLPIGTAVPRLLFEHVGGFRERDFYEDYELWARCWSTGAALVKVPDAVYVADWRRDSRNKRGTPQDKVRAHFEIGRELFPHIYDEAWLARHLRGGYRGERRKPARAA